MSTPKTAFTMPHVPGQAIASPWAGAGKAIASAVKKPPPLPAAAKGLGGAVFSGGAAHKVVTGSAELQHLGAAFMDELTKIGEELTTAAREHIKKKDFAVSAKASNTGKPAYPIEDKAHARSALGFAAMHHDGKDLAAVRAKVEKKFPGMVKEKKADVDFRAAFTITSKVAAELFKEGFDTKAALKAALEEAGPALGATAGAGIAAGLGRSTLGGAALGYGAGSLPSLLAGGHGKKQPA